MKHLTLFAFLFALTACGSDPGGTSGGTTTTAPNVVADDDEVVTVDICTDSAGSAPDIFVTGSGNQITIATGCSIRILEISGSLNYLTVETAVSIETVNLTVTSNNNVFDIPMSSNMNAYNDNGTDNALLNLRQ